MNTSIDETSRGRTDEGAKRPVTSEIVIKFQSYFTGNGDDRIMGAVLYVISKNTIVILFTFNCFVILLGGPMPYSVRKLKNKTKKSRQKLLVESTLRSQ